MLNTDEIIKYNKTNFSCYYTMKLDLEELIKAKYNIDEQGCSLLLGVDMSLSLETKKSIIGRLIDLYDEQILLKTYHQDLINEILDKYFCKIAKKVKEILNEISSEETEACCHDGCVVF